MKITSASRQSRREFAFTLYSRSRTAFCIGIFLAMNYVFFRILAGDMMHPAFGLVPAFIIVASLCARAYADHCLASMRNHTDLVRLLKNGQIEIETSITGFWERGHRVVSLCGEEEAQELHNQRLHPEEFIGLVSELGPDALYVDRILADGTIKQSLRYRNSASVYA